MHFNQQFSETEHISSVTTLPNTKSTSYIMIPGCVFEHIINTKDLTNFEKLYYLAAASLTSINSAITKENAVSLSSEQWSKRLGCSKTQIFSLQKSLESKNYFLIAKDINKVGQHKRNKITPSLPKNIFEQLLKSTNKYGINQHNANSEELHLLHNSTAAIGLEYLSKTKLFITIDYQLLKEVVACDSLTTFAKIVFLSLYIKAYKANRGSFKTDAENLNVITDYKSYAKVHNCSKSVLSRAISNLKNTGLITCKQFHTKQAEALALEDRQDKSLWQISLKLKYSEILRFTNTPNDRQNKLLIYDKAIPNSDHEIAEFSQYNNKDIILNNIDNIDIKKTKKSKSFNLKVNKEENNKEVYAGVISPSSMSKPIKLSEMPSFTEEEISLLQAKSGREFDLNFTNQLLLKFQKIKGDSIFPNKLVFLNYFAKVLKYEKHDSVQTSNDDFRLKCNIPVGEGVIDIVGNEIATKRRKHQYLQHIENGQDNSLEAQLRRKVAGGFEDNIAYDLLQNLHDSQQINPEEISFGFRQEITALNNQQTKDKLLQIAQSVYGPSINNINIQFNRKYSKENAKNQIPAHMIINADKDVYIPTIDKNSLWGRVRIKLIESYDIYADKHWFSKLIATENLEKKQLSLKAPTNFVRDWINRDFYSQIKRLCDGHGIMLEELG